MVSTQALASSGKGVLGHSVLSDLLMQAVFQCLREWKCEVPSCSLGHSDQELLVVNFVAVLFPSSAICDT
jgi:hypothetical protein